MDINGSKREYYIFSAIIFRTIKSPLFFAVLALVKYVQLSMVEFGAEFCQVLSRWIYFFGGFCRDLRG